ncbi:hypothetical protein J1N35_008326, partial [Gossypium stocksii]
MDKSIFYEFKWIDISKLLRKVQLNGNGQNQGNWRNGVEIIESKVEASTETNEGKKRSGEKSELMGLKEKEKIKGGKEDSESGSTIEKRHTRLMCDRGGRNWVVIFLRETKLHSKKIARVRDQCRLDGCLAIKSVGKSGGLAMLWKDGIKVDIQNYSRHHIDSVIQLKDQRSFRFTKFYRYSDLNQRNDSWNMLKKVGLRSMKFGLL